MCVAGKDLRPGDCVFGWDEPRIPCEYPDGREAFVVFMGEGTSHDRDAEEHRRTRTCGTRRLRRGEKTSNNTSPRGGGGLRAQAGECAGGLVIVSNRP